MSTQLNTDVIKRPGQPMKYNNSTDMLNDIESYLLDRSIATIEKKDKQGNIVKFMKPLFYLSLCLDGLGMVRETASVYARGDYDDKDNNVSSKGSFSDTLAYAREKCLSDQLEGSTIGLYNDRMIRLNLMSNYGYTEKHETTSTKEIIVRPMTLDEMNKEIELQEQQLLNE